MKEIIKKYLSYLYPLALVLVNQVIAELKATIFHKDKNIKTEN